MDDGGWPEGGVGTWIERWARWGPDRPALVTGERSVSYGELADRVRRLSGALRDLGVERGDRVGWIGPNHPAFIEALFAAARLGAALAPVNHRLPVEQRAAILADTEPVVLI
jgi:fatty-acyl-CoA synthase